MYSVSSVSSLELGHHNGQKNNVDGIVAEFVRRLLTKQAITAFSALISKHKPPGPQQPAFNRPKPLKILYNYRKRVLQYCTIRCTNGVSPKNGGNAYLYILFWISPGSTIVGLVYLYGQMAGCFRTPRCDHAVRSHENNGILPNFHEVEGQVPAMFFRWVFLASPCRRKQIVDVRRAAISSEYKDLYICTIRPSHRKCSPHYSAAVMLSLSRGRVVLLHQQFQFENQLDPFHASRPNLQAFALAADADNSSMVLSQAAHGKESHTMLDIDFRGTAAAERRDAVMEPAIQTRGFDSEPMRPSRNPVRIRGVDEVAADFENIRQPYFITYHPLLLHTFTASYANQGDVRPPLNTEREKHVRSLNNAAFYIVQHCLSISIQEVAPGSLVCIPVENSVITGAPGWATYAKRGGANELLLLRKLPRHTYLTTRRHGGSVHQRLTQYNAKGIEGHLVSYYKLQAIQSYQALPQLFRQNTTACYNPFSICSVTLVLASVAIVALLFVCFAFPSVFLFEFWSTFLTALLSFLTLLSFWKMVYLLLWMGLGTNAPMSLPPLGSPADIILLDGTKLTILYGLLVVYDPEEETEIMLPVWLDRNYSEPLEKGFMADKRNHIQSYLGRPIDRMIFLTPGSTPFSLVLQ
ncbi:uncharacterized protein BDR25DRAFT_350216 [Lindgomyces ingoldianus]|uniref:Uncharacterized protein n=1 Tax=Lindgomyces ingoldianus TaxID=673940 RepID=A0ACB6RBU4_9PLEO|nr:uncharacterized protein BDR25DRAFT_350216 [Lindgomyces ingoldianus]KAF2475941.1 hypothetical protein BDR25DRAFT_350216 [Lindgomyces ingoldianus]